MYPGSYERKSKDRTEHLPRPEPIKRSSLSVDTDVIEGVESIGRRTTAMFGPEPSEIDDFPCLYELDFKK